MFRRKRKEEQLSAFVIVTFGNFHFEGDFRTIAPTMEAITTEVMPVYEIGNQQAKDMGLVMKAPEDNGEGFQ